VRESLGVFNLACGFGLEVFPRLAAACGLRGVDAPALEHAAEGLFVECALANTLLLELSQQPGDFAVVRVDVVRALQVADGAVELKRTRRCRRDECLSSPGNSTTLRIRAN